MDKENNIQLAELEEKSQQSTLLDVISGRESIKFDVSLSWDTIIYVALAVILIGILLIYMQKIILK